MSEQWVVFKITNVCPDTIKISNAHLSEYIYICLFFFPIPAESFRTVGVFFPSGLTKKTNCLRILSMDPKSNLGCRTCPSAPVAKIAAPETNPFEVKGRVVARVEWYCSPRPGLQNPVTSSSFTRGYSISHRGNISTGAIGEVVFELSILCLFNR
ncbi:hypothetical protein BDV38DRAFT_258070 [Aspergillus pseudotamarii]|uniref:Uncharacterized protein n=1 Tax=Aspergillus pseudotamarii TaxID=132259 RepID=A0A5N6SJ84_ASPPS|nr:uncharacterized protein BDV38DRAFT_258070 [Aspergillus pseudotamarii]KAE8133443.1 hypothetical protein BDV38DRAFT_258070 [Aspergillus pseudotamarii]